MRKCNHCKVEKPLEEFPKDKSRSLGRAYRCKPCMVEVYNHQYLWDNRQSQRVYDAFADIWGCEELWVTIDRANLNFPKRKRSGTSFFLESQVNFDRGNYLVRCYISHGPPPQGIGFMQ